MKNDENSNKIAVINNNFALGGLIEASLGSEGFIIINKSEFNDKKEAEEFLEEENPMLIIWDIPPMKKSFDLFNSIEKGGRSIIITTSSAKLLELLDPSKECFANCKIIELPPQNFLDFFDLIRREATKEGQIKGERQI